MERILKGWNFMRVVRLLIGLYAGWQSVVMQEWMLGLAGVFVAGTALMNVGCCGVNSCQPMIKTKTGAAGSPKDVIYEEVDA
jgi:hypothetical protein